MPPLVFPAHAGIGPPHRTGQVSGWSLPRARGDRPDGYDVHAAAVESSPRTRGSAPARTLQPGGRPVFPAHAGIGDFVPSAGRMPAVPVLFSTGEPLKEVKMPFTPTGLSNKAKGWNGTTAGGRRSYPGRRWRGRMHPNHLPYPNAVLVKLVDINVDRASFRIRFHLHSNHLPSLHTALN